MRAHEILNEMVIRHHEQGGEWVIAFQDSIWITKAQIEPEVAEEIAARTGMQPEESIYDFNTWAEERPDILTGHLHGGMLEVDGVTSMKLHPQSSILVKKVVKALGLGGALVNRSDYDGEEYQDEVTPGEMLGRIPDIVYHGTNARFIYKILRVGIAPNTNANWEEIGSFNDRVFFASNFREAVFQANRQAEKHKSAPIVIATRIPDRTKITLDFDVAASLYGPGSGKLEPAYAKKAYASSAAAVQAASPKMDFTREIGTFAYKGRVPSSMFVAFYVPGSSGMMTNENIVEIKSRQEMFDAMDMIEDFGYFDPSFDPDEDGDEDDWDQ